MFCLFLTSEKCVLQTKTRNGFIRRKMSDNTYGWQPLLSKY